MKFKGEYSTAEIGDYNDICECVTIARGTASRGKTVVGSHNLLMAYVHIGAHDDVVGSHCVIANRVSLAGEVEVGDWAVIGGHAARAPVGTHRRAYDDSGRRPGRAGRAAFITVTNENQFAESTGSA